MIENDFDAMETEADASDARLACAIKIIAGVAVGVWAIVVLTYLAWFGRPLSSDQAIWGQFGDFAGGVLNPIFSLAAFIALLFAIRLQRYELALTKIELKKASSALKAQSDASRAQGRTARIQLFESALFQMLSRLTDVLSRIKYQKKWTRDEMKEPSYEEATKKVGIGALGEYIKSLRSAYGSPAAKQSNTPAQAVDLAWGQMHQEGRKELLHYFRTVFQIFSMIDNYRGSTVRKMKYARLVRAQLSVGELILLFYHARSGRTEFGLLIAKYAIFKHVDQGDLLADDHRDIYYGPGAFKDSP